MSEIRKLDGPPIPMLVDGLLTTEQVKQLFTDLAAHSVGLEIRDRMGKTYAPEKACELLVNRKVQALQLRYRFDNYDWTDTLMLAPQAFRAVRCRHEPFE